MVYERLQCSEFGAKWNLLLGMRNDEVNGRLNAWLRSTAPTRLMGDVIMSCMTGHGVNCLSSDDLARRIEPKEVK